MLGQSRGWLVALPLTLLVFIAIVPGRARAGAVLLAVAVAVLAFLGPVLDVFRRTEEGLDPTRWWGTRPRAILLTALVLALVGVLAAFADRGVELAAPAARRVRAGTVAALATVVLAAAGVGIASIGDPVAEASDAWADFKAGSDPGEQPSGSSRFTSAVGGQPLRTSGGSRLERFAEHPLIGDGTGNFQNAYLREGDSTERPAFPTASSCGLLSETGLVGMLLFAGAVLAAVVAAARAITPRSGLAAATALTALATFVYWVLHGSVDWLYELPALAAPALAMLGVAGALSPRQRLAEPRRGRSEARWWAVGPASRRWWRSRSRPRRRSAPRGSRNGR